ncbi:hypothetical protein BH10BAC1_BH10BAC1_14980 [soil metagenome]
MKHLKHILLSTSLFFSINISIAQPFMEWNDSIQVSIAGTPLANPWAGGLNFIQASNIDLNMDGIKDLFIFDRTGNKIRTFINKGTVGAVDYKYSPYYETKFPKLQEWALLVDYNCDGLEDIFGYADYGGGFKVYKNTSTMATGLQFTLVTNLQYSIFNPPGGSLINLYVSSADVPALTDIDDDGDLDVVTFAITGTYMEYHKNMSMELYGTCDSLKFQIANRCWGYAAENSLSNNYTLFDTCTGNVSTPELTPHNSEERSAERHSGSCELCIDLDNDGDKEFIVGDISFNNLTMLTNGGSLTGASFVSSDIAFPANTASTAAVDLTVFPCAYYVDVNDDGVKDLIVSPNAPNVSENFNSVVYYKNNGTNSAPIFQFQQTNVLQDNMVDVGEGAYPVFFDYDNDGLLDLFVGNFGYYGASGYGHQIAQFRNIGTATVPKFDLITRDYAGLSALGISNMVPAFGDLDGDTDADMMIGGADGKLHYFENIAPIGSTANFVLTTPNFKNSFGRVIDVGDYATPQIVDMDNNGTNDLVIGSRNGKLAYYRHTGTTPIPVMDSITHFFGGVKVNLPFYVTGYSYPFVFKQGSVTNMLVGTESGVVRRYNNIDGNLGGTFTWVDSTFMNINQGARVAPNGADINNDGLMDLIVGNYEGGISFYKGIVALTTSNLDNFIHFNYDLFPNPANNNFSIRILNEENKIYVLELYNVMGQLISSEKIEHNFSTLSTQTLSNGVYVCKVSEINLLGQKQTGSLTKRIIVQH